MYPSRIIFVWSLSVVYRTTFVTIWKLPVVTFLINHIYWNNLIPVCQIKNAGIWLRKLFPHAYALGHLYLNLSAKDKVLGWVNPSLILIKLKLQSYVVSLTGHPENILPSCFIWFLVVLVMYLDLVLVTFPKCNWTMTEGNNMGISLLSMWNSTLIGQAHHSQLPTQS